MWPVQAAAGYELPPPPAKQLSHQRARYPISLLCEPAMNKMPRHHHYPRPPAYGAERDPLLQSSSSSSPPFDTLPSYHQTNQAATYRPGSHVRGSTESGRSTAGGAAQRTCRCIDLNVLFIVLFGALAGTSLWLVVKSARPVRLSLCYSSCFRCVLSAR